MSTHTDANVNNLVINEMTKSIYDSLDFISDTELYYITDDDLYLKSNNIKTINGISIVGTGDITISGGSGSSIDDTTVSTTSTYSSSKIDTTYLKAPEGRLNLTNGRITLNNDINSAYLINNDEKLVTLNGDGLSYQDKAKNITVNITPYYGGSDQALDPAGLKVNGVTLAPETALLKKVSKSGDNMTGALTVPSITVDATTPATGTTSLKDGCINFKYKNSDDAAWNAWLEITPAGTLQFGSTGGIASEIGTVATQEWVNKKVSNTYKFKGSVNTYDDLPGAADSGDVYNVLSNGANYAWTGTEWDELGATINLDSYALKTEVDKKQDKLTAGNGITITGNVISSTSDVDLSNYYTAPQINTLLSQKQVALISGKNIKTINGQSLLGSGNIQINSPEVDLSGYYTKAEVDNKIPDISNLASIEYVENKVRDVTSVTFRDWGK